MDHAGACGRAGDRVSRPRAINRHWRRVDMAAEMAKKGQPLADKWKWRCGVGLHYTNDPAGWHDGAPGALVCCTACKRAQMAVEASNRGDA